MHPGNFDEDTRKFYECYDNFRNAYGKMCNSTDKGFDSLADYYSADAKYYYQKADFLKIFNFSIFFPIPDIRSLNKIEEIPFIYQEGYLECREKDWFRILVKLEEILSSERFINLEFRGSAISHKNILKLLSLKNHENIESIILMANNNQMDIVESLFPDLFKD